MDKLVELIQFVLGPGARDYVRKGDMGIDPFNIEIFQLIDFSDEILCYAKWRAEAT